MPAMQREERDSVELREREGEREEEEEEEGEGAVRECKL